MILEGHDDAEPTLVCNAWDIDYMYQVEEWLKVMLVDYPMVTNFRLFEGTLPGRGATVHSGRLIGHWVVKDGKPVKADLAQVPTLQAYRDVAPAAGPTPV